MNKTLVTIFRKPWNGKPWTESSFKERDDWFADRYEALSYQSFQDGENAAEEAFHLTNAPEECLEESQIALLKSLDFKGPSLSVGDIVKVEPFVRGFGSKQPQYFLCKPYGWEKYEKDPIQLLKHLSY